MATQVQYRRGTASQNATFTGALGEITVDTTNGTLRVHDGISAGGSNIATVAYVTSQISSLSANSISDGTSSVSIIATNGNVRTNVGGATISTVYSGGVLVTGLISATGNISCGNLSASGNVTAANIDSVNADLAEQYLSDQDYPPGTVVVFGGPQEITQSIQYADSRIAGVISTSPAYTMNSGSSGLPVALQGRVPCRVLGSIQKGDLITSSDQLGVATKLDPQDWRPGSIIGKALENYNSDQEGIIEVVVGRL